MNSFKPRQTNIPIEATSMLALYGIFNGTFSLMQDDPFSVGIAGTFAGAGASIIQNLGNTRLYPESLLESKTLPNGFYIKDAIRAGSAWGMSFIIADMLRLGAYRTRQLGGSVTDVSQRYYDPYFHLTNFIAGFSGGIAGKALSLFSWYGPVQAPIFNRSTTSLERFKMISGFSFRTGLALLAFGLLDAATGLEAHPERWIAIV